MSRQAQVTEQIRYFFPCRVCILRGKADAEKVYGAMEHFELLRKADSRKELVSFQLSLRSVLWEEAG